MTILQSSIASNVISGATGLTGPTGPTGPQGATGIGATGQQALQTPQLTTGPNGPATYQPATGTLRQANIINSSGAGGAGNRYTTRTGNAGGQGIIVLTYESASGNMFMMF